MRELTQAREEVGWSQRRLAEESGVNAATISQIETGRRSPNIETLEKLATAMDREMSDFFPKAQAPLFTSEQVVEPRRTEAIIDELREWRQIAGHVQEFARADREELQNTEELPRGWQRGVFGARTVYDNVGRLSREAAGLDDDVPRELSEAVEEAKAAANAVLTEALQFFHAAEVIANKAGVREDADIHDLRELLGSWAA